MIVCGKMSDLEQGRELLELMNNLGINTNESSSIHASLPPQPPSTRNKKNLSIICDSNPPSRRPQEPGFFLDLSVSSQNSFAQASQDSNSNTPYQISPKISSGIYRSSKIHMNMENDTISSENREEQYVPYIVRQLTPPSAPVGYRQLSPVGSHRSLSTTPTSSYKNVGNTPTNRQFIATSPGHRQYTSTSPMSHYSPSNIRSNIEDRGFPPAPPPTISTGKSTASTFDFSEAAIAYLDGNRQTPKGSTAFDQFKNIDTPINQSLVYEVRFKHKKGEYILSYDCPRDIRIGDLVKVEADRGTDIGEVHNVLPIVSPAAVSGLTKQGVPIRKILGRATSNETMFIMTKSRDEMGALTVCREMVTRRKMDIQVLDAEFQFDRKKLTFLFISDKRTDFRELVRDLFSFFKTRIWMQKISVAQAVALMLVPANQNPFCDQNISPSVISRIPGTLPAYGDDDDVNEDYFEAPVQQAHPASRRILINPPSEIDGDLQFHRSAYPMHDGYFATTDWNAESEYQSI